jgi:hypothetical protein
MTTYRRLLYRILAEYLGCPLRKEKDKKVVYGRFRKYGISRRKRILPSRIGLSLFLRILQKMNAF